ncbi:MULTISPECIES: hypothetical protein [Pseudomonas]|jgi:FtsZ-binding cell division protein ZapB|uniref:hypothetical protein n=1 Tax=Pseudomonas TaxID=286 RepID=UPI00064B90E0|nr:MULTISPECIES: hypothetical protein [Pseudomonas]MDN6861919.1 hypothetical protein [Pseudomonas rhodesiae]
MTDYTDIQKAAAYAAQDTIRFADEDEEMRAFQQFHEEVSPETVLALIADIDEARNGMKHSCAIRLKKQIEQLEKERDQLKSENEALRNALRPLLAHWDDVRPGESLNVDAARAAMGKGEQS